MPVTPRLLAKSNAAVSFGTNDIPVFPIQQAYTSTIRNAYPSASLTEAWGDYTVNFIRSQGHQPENTLFALGICSDDVDAFTANGNIGQFPKSMQSFLGPFQSGGLAGYPFVGSVGLGAFASHITDTGGLFISSTPHIGVTSDGQIGRQYRRGQASVTASSNCGAVHGAVGLVSSDPLPPTQSNAPYNNENYELWRLSNILYPYSSSFSGTEGKNIFTASAYISEAGIDYIRNNSSSYHDAATGSNVFLLGGVFVNTDDSYQSYIDVKYFYKYSATGSGSWEDLSATYRSGLYALPDNAVRTVSVYSQELDFSSPLDYVSLRIKYEDLNSDSSGNLVSEYTNVTVYNIDQLVNLFNAEADFNQYGTYSKSDRNNKLVLTMTDLTKYNLLEGGTALISLQVFED
jgi:hypothetical protein